MRRRFWQFVHDRLERAWHWAYYHKLARPLPPIVQSNIKYGWRSVSYITGLGEICGPYLIDFGPNYLMNKTLDGSPCARYQCSICGGRAEPCIHWKSTENG